MKEHDIIAAYSTFLLDTMMLGKPPDIPERFASVDSLQTIYAMLISLREFLYAASNGDLSGQVPFKGFVAGALKTLQANLKHMTWQTKMIASGDFTQRVEFMGEFSQSFNAMVMQLDQTLKELVRKEMALKNANNELLKEISTREQIEQALRKSQETLKRQAITDSLTGIYNRRHFNKLAAHEINRAIRYSFPISIIMFDIDFFKRVNDTYGHMAGDIVLKLVASVIRKMVRESDVFARYGGEEFIILLPETTVKDGAIVAEKIRRKIQETAFQVEQFSLSVTASFGISDFFAQTDKKTLDMILSEFIANADRALYASKNGGRNMVTVFSAEEHLVTDYNA